MKTEKVIENGEQYIVKKYNNGTKCWYNNKGQYHRLGGLPAKEYYDGGKLYHKVYYENGKLHRINGPAYENIDGHNSHNSYWIFNKNYTEQEYYDIIKNPEKLQNLINMEIIKEII